MQGSMPRFLPLVPIVLGAIGLAWPYVPAAELPVQRFVQEHPVLQKALPPVLAAPDLAPPLTGNWLIIPAINVKEEIWDGSSLDVVWTHEGVWHQTGDLAHNLVLAGHRFQYLPPNTHTFYNLSKLKPGDTVTVVWEGTPHRFAVSAQETVPPTDGEPLDQSGPPRLTLYTCADWATTRRLVVVAVPR